MNSGLVDYIEFIWHGMKLGLSYFCWMNFFRCMNCGWQYSMAALQWAKVYDMTMMAFGQCRHVNSTMMSVFPL